MRLLITTQAVDLDDPVLGFFHAWIESLASRYEHVHVICLKEGRHLLPSNVTIHSLGKEVGRSRFGYIERFFRYIYKLRREYDAVFVHMNSEYVCLGGLFWRSWGKRIVLWRNHKKAGFTTWLAAQLSDAVLYTSPSSYVAQFPHAKRMPIGIDTDRFRPRSGAAPESILFFGRLDQVKHPDIFVEALGIVHEHGTAFTVDIVGDPTEEDSKYAHDLRNLAGPLALDGTLKMRPAIPNGEAPELFTSHAIYVNLTPSGSFDKTIGEAAASGCIIVAGNDVLRGVLPDALVVDPFSRRSVAAGVEAALCMSPSDRAILSEALRSFVVQKHSLSLLCENLVGILNA